MKQDEKWVIRYNEVKDFIETTHRNPSRHFVENRNLLSWIKQQRKLNFVDFCRDSIELKRALLYARCSRSCSMLGC